MFLERCNWNSTVCAQIILPFGKGDGRGFKKAYFSHRSREQIGQSFLIFPMYTFLFPAENGARGLNRTRLPVRVKQV